MPTANCHFVYPWVLLALSTVACGGRAFESGRDASGGATNGGDGGSATSGGSNAGSGDLGGAATAGSAQGGSPAGGAGTAGTASGGSAGSGGSPECDAFLNETGSTVQVRLTNETRAPLYLGSQTPGCSVGAYFQVRDAAGTPLTTLGSCATTCATLMQATIRVCPPTLCIVASVVTLQPGESVMQQWDASYFVTAELTPACRPADGTRECQRVVAAQPGAYTFSAVAGTKIDCSDYAGDPCTACMPDNNGGCLNFGAIIGGARVAAEAQVTLDGSYGLGAAGGGGKTRPVEIVFK